MKTGYCIKTIKYKLRCSHPEWLTETEKYYRQVLDFYFRLLLEHEEIWELNVLQMGAGVNLDRYELAEYPLGQNIRFLFMGRVMKEKGINELFEAMHRLYSDGINCSLDILGGYEEDYKDIIQHYEKEGWLHYHGFQADVRPFIANCHCFVLPSWHEGMANTNLESAASGRPVITSNIHGCLEAVEDTLIGFSCQALIDYYGMRKACKTNIYNTRVLFVLSAIIFAISIFSIELYKHALVRYLIILVFLIILILFRKKITSLFKLVRGKGDNNE